MSVGVPPKSLASLLPLIRPFALILIGTYAVLWIWVAANSHASGYALWDADAYWQAALRLRAGHPLYDPGIAADAPNAYRYAPWFAMVWVPLTYLPQPVVLVGWAAILIVAWVASLWPLRRSIPALLFFAGATFYGVWVGNVQSLMIVPLVYRLGRHDGPLWVAVAASLKATPILLTLWYVGRGEWGRAALAVALTGLLVAPMLAFDLAGYPLRSDSGISIFGATTLLWALAIIATGAAALRLARGSFGPLAAGVAVIAALPRLALYDVSFVLTGLASRKTRRPGA